MVLVLYGIILHDKGFDEIKKAPTPQSCCKTGTFSARSGVRTLDTLIQSQVLYQLS